MLREDINSILWNLWRVYESCRYLGRFNGAEHSSKIRLHLCDGSAEGIALRQYDAR